MANVTVTTDVDNLLKSADNAAARTSLGLGTAAEAATGDFATAAEGILAGTALQPADPTLESVTTNGATTLNNIGVGKIATLHPTNPVNDNIASGNSSASIGGTANQATGNRTATFGGRSNTVEGSDSSSFGGLSQTVRGHESEGFGGTNITLNTKYTNTVGGAGHVIGLATSGVGTSVAKHSITVGGEDSIIEDAIQTAIVGGSNHKIQTGDDRSVILGGTGITTDATDTVYVPNLNVKDGFKMPTGATDTYVLTSDANGVGTWQVAGGGGGGGGGTVQGTDQTYDIQPTNEGATAGNARGENSVDLQTYRTLSTQVASGNMSTLAGGYGNTASGTYSFAMGFENTASGDSSACIGGWINNADGWWGGAVIAGGGGNTVTNSGVYSFMGGGFGNTVSGYYAATLGGRYNTAEATSGGATGGALVGGESNTITSSGLRCAVVGGQNNNTSTFEDVIIAGTSITADRANCTFVSNLSIKSIPTSSAGLPAGSVWNDGGTLKIV